MASKLIYPVVAVVGIAAASAAAWWFQNKPAASNAVAAEGGRGGASARGPGAGAGQGGGSGPRVVGVEVARVQAQQLRDDAESVGSLRSRQSVMLRPEVAGRVRELGFSDGAVVRRGQLLVQLDDTLQRAEIRQAAAQVSIAQANYKRNQELVAQGFVAQRSLDESAASMQVAEAQLALGCARLMRMAIVAPFDATVGMRNVNLGDYVKDGADLINLEDTSSMYVDFRLPERYQGKLRVRQQVEVHIDALPGRLFRATVEAIDPLLDVNGRSVGVRAVLPNTAGEALGAGGRGAGAGGRGGSGATAGPGGGGGARPDAAPREGAAAAARPGTAPAAPRAAAGTTAARAAMPARAPAPVPGCPAPEESATAMQAAPRAGFGGPLRPGMFARVTTVFDIRDSALVVPEEAIVPQGGRQFVIKVVPQDGVVPASGENARPALVSRRQQVVLGVRQLGKVEVLQGLAEGDTVVIAGHQRLQADGTALRIVPQGGSGGREGGAGGAGGGGRPPGAPASGTPAADQGSSAAPVKADSGVVPANQSPVRTAQTQPQ